VEESMKLAAVIMKTIRPEVKKEEKQMQITTLE
jgi:hypothetical protein